MFRRLGDGQVVPIGAATLQEAVGRSLISTVNWAEVAQACIARDADPVAARTALTTIGLELVPLDVADAEAAATMRPITRASGLSLADRCRRALAARHRLPAPTADPAWADVLTAAAPRWSTHASDPGTRDTTFVRASFSSDHSVRLRHTPTSKAHQPDFEGTQMGGCNRRFRHSPRIAASASKRLDDHRVLETEQRTYGKGVDPGAQMPIHRRNRRYDHTRR